MTYLDRAIKDGYAIITGPENKQKIKIYRRYHPLQIPWYSFAVTLCPTKIPSIMSAVKKQRSRQIN